MPRIPDFPAEGQPVSQGAFALSGVIHYSPILPPDCGYPIGGEGR